jgi:hypothetical protein
VPTRRPAAYALALFHAVLLQLLALLCRPPHFHSCLATPLAACSVVCYKTTGPDVIADPRPKVEKDTGINVAQFVQVRHGALNCRTGCVVQLPLCAWWLLGLVSRVLAGQAKRSVVCVACVCRPPSQSGEGHWHQHGTVCAGAAWCLGLQDRLLSGVCSCAHHGWWALCRACLQDMQSVVRFVLHVCVLTLAPKWGRTLASTWHSLCRCGDLTWLAGQAVLWSVELCCFRGVLAAQAARF